MRWPLAFSIIAWTAYASSQDRSQPEFTVASVKITTDRHSYLNVGGPGTPSPSRWTCSAVGLDWLMRKAWNLTRFQVPDEPALQNTLYEISALLPDNTSPEDFRLMIQGLLRSRFHLAAHLEKRPLVAYALSIGPGGPRLKSAEPENASSASRAEPASQSGRPASAQFEMDKEGRQQLVPGRKAIVSFGVGGVNRVLARMQSMTDLAHYLESQILLALVKDDTGLTGQYDFTLEFAKDTLGVRPIASGAPAEASTPAPDLAAALRRQLGLNLKPTKEPTDILVVDRYNPIPEGN